ncbi:unnamed protein product [Clonostachys rhizophaga]|uniref:Uncharacterized protein n=1 Tax=Clonostachys rhizophaga TaxID=160324 RepID=A0A9N9VBY2_9HYPO|nr:unnamed protein product [Clonostachys rhizophaga]
MNPDQSNCEPIPPLETSDELDPTWWQDPLEDWALGQEIQDLGPWMLSPLQGASNAIRDESKTLSGPTSTHRNVNDTSGEAGVPWIDKS